MEKKEFLKQIDRDSYILKNKLMAAFDKNFGTELQKEDADNLHFCDIMYAVYDRRPNVDATMLYPLLKRTAGHGVSNEQKNFLYKYVSFFAKNEAGADFEEFCHTVQEGFDAVSNSGILAGMKMGLYDEAGPFIISIYQYPMVFIEFFRLVPETDNKIEAMLVQNGAVLIIRTVHDEMEMLESPFQNDQDADFDDDDYDDDDNEPY